MHVNMIESSIKIINECNVFAVSFKSAMVVSWRVLGLLFANTAATIIIMKHCGMIDC